MSKKTFTLTIALEKGYNNRPGVAAKKILDDISFDIVKTKGFSEWAPHTLVKRSQDMDEGSNNNNWIAKGAIHFTKNIVNETDDQLQRRATKLLSQVIGKAEKKDWTIKAASSGDYFYDIEAAKDVSHLYGEFDVAEVLLPVHWHDYFTDIYELDAQIRIAFDIVSSFIASKYKKRSHACFYGLPGSGKSSVADRFAQMLEQVSPPGAVLRLTASQTTKAGLENLLINLDPKPTFIIIEEIDKGLEDNLTCLLDLCNAEGRLKKTNAHVGNVDIAFNSLVFCTVNNIVKFRKILAGAISSRFSQKLFFPRGSKDVLRKIALREMSKFYEDVADSKKKKWIEAALIQMDAEGSNDPRRMLAILDARNRLIDHSYQKDYDKMLGQLKVESANIQAQIAMNKDLNDSLRIDDEY